MGDKNKAPATLPADFNQWDARTPNVLPANFFEPDDPAGNYDFGDLGKVKGLKVNGKPATRQQAFNLLSGQRDVGQQLGQNMQRKQADIQNYVQGATSTDQQTKEFMGDLAQMAVMGGAAKAGQIWRTSDLNPLDALKQAVATYQPSGNVRSLIGREISGKIPVLNRFEGTRPPTFAEWMDALKPNPQLNLFRNTPKLGNAPLDVNLNQLSPIPASTPLSQVSEALNTLKLPESPPAYESDVDMITRRAPPREGFTGEQSKVGFGTAPGNIPIEERMTPPEGAYAKTPPRSNLSKNQKQLAARQAQAPAQPTVKASTDFPQEIQDILNRPASSYQPQDYDTLHDFFARQGKYAAPTQKPAGFSDTADALKTLKLPEKAKAKGKD